MYSWSFGLTSTATLNLQALLSFNIELGAAEMPGGSYEGGRGFPDGLDYHRLSRTIQNPHQMIVIQYVIQYVIHYVI